MDKEKDIYDILLEKEVGVAKKTSKKLEEVKQPGRLITRRRVAWKRK